MKKKEDTQYWIQNIETRIQCYKDWIKDYEREIIRWKAILKKEKKKLK